MPSPNFSVLPTSSSSYSELHPLSRDELPRKHPSNSEEEAPSPAPLVRSKARYEITRSQDASHPSPENKIVVSRSRSCEEISPVLERKVPTLLRLSASDSAVAASATKTNRQRPYILHRNPLYQLPPEKATIVDALLSRNPLYWNDNETLSAWAGKMAKWNHDIKKGAQKLSECLNSYETRHQRGIAKLTQIRRSLTSPRDIDNFDRMLAHILISASHEEIICPFLTTSRSDFPSFATKMMDAFREAKVTDPACLVIISRITRVELGAQREETLFREENLSSSLCRQYGVGLWADALKGIKDSIARKMKHSDIGQLLLDYHLVENALKEQEPAFGNLPRMEREGQIVAEQQKNAWRFVKFGRGILEKIYAASIPENFSILLKSRRDNIARFLQANCHQSAEEASVNSRIYVAEILFLRILNPHILDIDASPEAHAVLKSLTKVMQSLANETPFGQEKRNSIYESLNPLFLEFLPKHQAFLDRCSAK